MSARISGVVLSRMDDVWEYYRDFLQAVEKEIAAHLQSQVSLINAVAYYTLNSGGKRFRPLLMVITSGLYGHPQDQDIILLASVVEFIHTASLLHDDVIDNGEIRRGQKAARAVWGNQSCILVGDFLYTQSLRQVVKLESPEVNYCISHACSTMVEGEILQLNRDGDMKVTEQEYLKIIECKTASLISAACRLVSIVGGASPEEKEAISRFGLNIGIAFQVADDTLDYVADTKRLGKSLGKDLKEGKITLPLLHLLQHCSAGEKKCLKRIITSGNGLMRSGLAEIRRLMEKYGSIDYSLEKARFYAEQAKRELLHFEPSIHRQALSLVADYVVSRDH